MPFPEALDVRVIDGGKYKLINRFVWVAPNRGEIIVPSGFVCDFASIPNAWRWLFTGHARTRKPAVIHDYLYRKAIGKRKDADRVFRLCMKEAGMPRWRRALAYSAVRLFGWATWGNG